MTDQNRKAWLSQLAQAPTDRLTKLWESLGLDPAYRLLRAPEIGTVMVTGRTGGTGTPFNLGEMTVARCSLELEDGPIGHGYVQGRSQKAARYAALIDALMQTERATTVGPAIIEPLRREAEERRNVQAARAAATKVEFFTMMRGEDL